MSSVNPYRSDRELIVGIRANNNLVITEVYERFLNPVVRLIVTNSGSSQEAEDIFQDAIIVLLEKINQDNFRLTASLQSYLMAICKNMWLRRLRDKGKHTIFNDSSEDIPDIFIDEDFELLSNQRIDAILKVLHSMGQRCTDLLYSFYFLKMSIRKIEEKYKYANQATAKNQKYKCMEKLRQLLSIQYPNLS